MPLSLRRVGDARADDTTRLPPPFLFRALRMAEAGVALVASACGAPLVRLGVPSSRALASPTLSALQLGTYQIKIQIRSQLGAGSSGVVTS